LEMDAFQLINHVEDLIANQEYHHAISAYQSWLFHSESPLRYAITFNLGVLFENLGRFDEAESHYKRSVSYKPNFMDARLRLAVQQERRGDIKEAAGHRNWIEALNTEAINITEPVSILIPVYNTPASQLSMCLQSIYAQTYSNYEILIVNDASSDQDTIAFINEISNKKVTVVTLPENKGISGALNIGLQRAKYELVARMDSDDMMLPSRLEKQLKYIRNNPQVDVLSTGLYYCTETEGIISFDPVPKVHPEIVTKDVAKKSRWFVNHPTVIYKKSKVLAVGGYDESLRGLPEDYDLWMRMLEAGMIIHNLQEPLLYLRLSSGSLSKSFNEDIEDFFRKRMHD
jgi:tetratricopeptide (TPR) repeat protein